MNALKDRYRRLQVGVAGLLSVLLLVGLASLLGGQGGWRGDRDGVMAAGDTAATGPKVALDKNTAIKAVAPSEPLAELGVQPAPADTVRQRADALPDQVAPGQQVPDLEPDPKLEQSRTR